MVALVAVLPTSMVLAITILAETFPPTEILLSEMPEIEMEVELIKALEVELPIEIVLVIMYNALTVVELTDTFCEELPTDT